MHEIVSTKFELFSQVVDRQVYTDKSTETSLSDLLYMLTGERDTVADNLEEDKKRLGEEKKRQKEHAKNTLYRKKKR